MIQEYALDPTVVAKWESHIAGSLIKEIFSRGSGRVVACPPGKDWRASAKEQIRAIQDDASRNRLTSLLSYLWDRRSRRTPQEWDNYDWIASAIKEHAAAPFKAIVSDDGVGRDPSVVSSEIDLGQEVWKAPRSRIVARQPEALVEAISPIIRASRQIVVVDPVLNAEPRFLRTLEAILGSAAGAAQCEDIIVVIRDNDAAEPWDSFCRRCRERLESQLREGLKLTLAYVPVSVQHRLHNRYIFSDVCGLVSGDSVDESNRDRAYETNDFALLDENHFRERQAQYVGLLADRRTKKLVLGERS